MKHLKLFFACLLTTFLSIGQMWATDYQLVTSTSDLEAGANYVIGNAASESGIFMATTSNSNNRKGTASITITNGKISATDAVLVLKLGGSTGAWTFQTTNYLGTAGYLAAASNNSNYCQVITDGTQARAQFTISFSGDAVVITATGGGNRRNMRYNPNNSNPIFACYQNATDQSPIYLFKEVTGEETACATPTFLPAAGAVLSGTTVAISCATDGAAIHYTTDGTTPTASSATYSSAITVSSAMTIKAIAVKDGLDNSEVASSSYTIATPLTTMDAIYSAATTAGSTATDVYVTFNNWVVTGVKNSNAYVTDGTKGFIVYTSSHGFKVGDILSGTAVCKVQLYNGSAELTELTSSKVTVNTGGSVSPVVLDAEGIAALTGANTGSVIKISGECTYESSKYYIAGVQLYNQLYSFSVTAGTNYECTGVYVFNTDYGKEILPRSAADIEAQTSVANPTFSPAAGEYTEVKNVTLSCTTNGATVYYTTDGTNPTNESTVYSSAIEVGASMTIKAIAYKGENHSEVVSAAYTINLPIPSHDFQITHNFTTGEGFEFPTGWGGSYAEHEIAYTDDKVHFASASKQSSNITDRPVVKEKPISLILTNSHKLISAVRFDYSQWTTKVPTLTMKYSTDGGETYSDFDPVVSTTDFALQVLTMPEGVNAIQVVGTADKQVGLTSIAFDLVDKPIVTKTVTITTPSNGTLTVMNGEDAVTSGDEIEVGSVLTISTEPAEGYILSEVTVNGSAYTESTLELTENVTIAATFEENLAPEVETYILSEAGVETSHLVSGMRVGDKVNLPLTAAECSKVFRGWDANADCATAPTYAPGEEYTLAANNKLYAVYADAIPGSTWEVATSVEAGDVVVISTNTGYTAHDMKTAGAISSSIFGCTASTYNANKSQITALAEGTLEFTVGGNATDGWTLMNGTKYLKVTATKKVNLVDDEETWSISFSSNNATLTPKTGDLTDYSIQYNYNSGNDRFTAYNTTQVAISLYKQAVSYSNYSTVCQAQVATPTFSPAAGTYTEVQTVAITTATADATIYYTTNGDEPTTSSTLYEGAITVDASKTLKAIAVKSGMTNSAVATAAYTINLPLSTMQTIFDAATSTATSKSIAFSEAWVVSGVSSDGHTAYLTDGTKGLILYNSSSDMELAVGNTLSGTKECTLVLYKGAAELKDFTKASLTVGTGGTVSPTSVAPASLSGVNTGALISLSSWKYDGSNLTDGTTDIQPFTTLYNCEETFVEDKYYNVSGIYLQFDSKKEILPRSATDIEEKNLLPSEIGYTPASATIELGEELPGTTFANPHELTISYSSNNTAVATVSNAGVISLEGATGTAVITASFAGNATYAAANVTYTITVNAAGTSQNVVILAQNGTKYYAMSTTIDNETAVPVEVEYDGTKVTVAKDADKDAIQWTKKTSGDNTTFQTKDEDKLYLKGTSGGGTLSLNANVCNWTWNGTNNCYVTGTRGFIYRVSVNGFKNYATSNLSNADYVAPQVIVIDPANIVVTSKAEPQLAYTPAEVTLTVGGEFTPAVLGYAESFDGLASVTYASNNEDVATVDESGVVSLVTDAIGTATITATFAGNNNYQAGSASYTITVNEAGDDLSGTWVLASSVAAGDKIIIMGANNADIYTMGKQNANNRAAVASTLSEDVLNPGAATKVFTLVDAGEGKFAIRASNGYYLTSATSGTSNNLLEAADYDLDNAKWTITIENGSYGIVAAAGSKTVMQYNSGSTLFSCYGSASQKPVKIYTLQNATPVEPELDWEEARTDLTAGYYYTMCLDKAVTHIDGASIWRVLSKTQEGSGIILEEVTGTLDAGRPYFFYATASVLKVVYTGDAVDAPLTEGNNGLVGSFTQEMIARSNDNYILYNNALYYVNTDNVKVGANRAYLNMAAVLEYNEGTPAPGRRRVTMQTNGEQVATGMDEVNVNSEVAVKTLIDGQLFILRGQKMYDTTGRLVK